MILQAIIQTDGEISVRSLSILILEDGLRRTNTGSMPMEML